MCVGGSPLLSTFILVIDLSYLSLSTGTEYPTIHSFPSTYSGVSTNGVEKTGNSYAKE